MNQQTAGVIGLVIAIILLSFNGFSMYTLSRSKELKKKRILVLALCLSVSDSLIGLEFLYGSILNLLKSNDTGYRYQCMVIRQFISGTIMASLLQTLIICLERINATFIIKQRILTALTSNISVAMCLLLPHVIALVRFGLDTLTGTFPCGVKYTAKLGFLYLHDIPAIFICCLIALSYGVVIFRITKKQKTIAVQVTELTGNQTEINWNKAFKMRQNMITLGIIIGLTFSSNLPRSVLVLYSYIVGGSDKAMHYLWAANNIFVLLNPLFDPFIYVLRIEKYREHLKSSFKSIWKSNRVTQTT
ncbi:unnamed protein product [Mytilus coruscus]|uniref:G-protein coupled receptors family 1 profile domain-containing protein n=1 Tax=Mytilus coruscus TaxID=42192 RepID=A0A6J8BQR6_MYTCO|nr:unnamed protein product [Mytilus coruscus]